MFGGSPNSVIETDRARVSCIRQQYVRRGQPRRTSKNWSNSIVKGRDKAEMLIDYLRKHPQPTTGASWPTPA